MKDIFGELIDQMESQVNFELKDLNNGQVKLKKKTLTKLLKQ